MKRSFIIAPMAADRRISTFTYSGINYKIDNNARSVLLSRAHSLFSGSIEKSGKTDLPV